MLYFASMERRDKGDEAPAGVETTPQSRGKKGAKSAAGTRSAAAPRLFAPAVASRLGGLEAMESALHANGDDETAPNAWLTGDAAGLNAALPIHTQPVPITQPLRSVSREKQRELDWR